VTVSVAADHLSLAGTQRISGTIDSGKVMRQFSNRRINQQNSYNDNSVNSVFSAAKKQPMLEMNTMHFFHITHKLNLSLFRSVISQPRSND